jgi:glycine oxidase
MINTIIIIGGGIIGCALARELARRGAQVTLLEARSAVGQEASGAAVGTLSYSPSASMPAGWHLLASQSLEAHRALSEQVAKEVPNPPRWHWPGRLSVASTNNAEKNSRTRLKADLALGDVGEWLNKRPIHEREPMLGGRVQGGSFKPGQGWVDAPHLTKALAEAAQHYGAMIHLNRPVKRILWEGTGSAKSGKRVVGVETAGSGALWYADHVIIAAGAWSGGLDSELALPPDTIFPVRGQALHLDMSETSAPTPLIRHLISGNGIYMIPEANGVTIGATHKKIGFQRGNTAGGLAKLLGNAISLVPILAEADWAEARIWSGFRPATPDKVPILGPDPRFDGLWWATGHFRSGILLAPVTATLLADAIVARGEIDEQFSVARFVLC